MKALAIITGVATLLLGAYGVCVPLRIFLSLGWILGALYLCNGLTLVIGAFQKKKEVWQGVLGGLVAVFGVIMLCNVWLRFLNDMMMAYFAGLSVLACGVCILVAGFNTWKVSKGMAVMTIICGVLALVGGVFAFLHPIMTMISVGYIICFNVIIQGVGMIAWGIAYKKSDAPAE
ncbi:MAG: DUF308 domain-containing protein [Ruminiclostridium sp.]|nr:DUF308 domain-containing protein [Ruminiclostridium sp.]